MEIKKQIARSECYYPVCSCEFASHALEYAVRRVRVNQDSLKLNGTHQLLVDADDVNIMGGSVHSVEKNTETFGIC